MRRRQLLAATGTGLVGGIAGCTGESDQTTPAFVGLSPAFDSGGALPARFTCDGAGDSPPVKFEKIPEPTAALAVVAKADAGAITNATFWSLWNVLPDTRRIPAGLPREPTIASLNGARQGRQEGGEVGYKPPCPPEGVPVEHWFQLYALEDRLAINGGATHEAATEAIQAAELASTQIIVTVSRDTTTNKPDQ